METIIIVSVLSTLGAVALVSSIVVAFWKLTNKVDVNDYNNEVDDIHRKIDEQIKDLYAYVAEDNEDIRQSTHEEREDIRRFLDSRCDKLDTKIQNLTTGGKQLLAETIK